MGERAMKSSQSFSAPAIARSRRPSAALTSVLFSLTFSTLVLPLYAHPGEQPNSGSRSDASLPTPSAAIAAVTVESDQQVRQEYDVLSLAATHLPNERHRYDAAWAAANGDWGDAARRFRLAARYADKYSQHRLSMLYWHGVGVERDPVEAYVWADLAAERGYPHFLAIREKMWAELTPSQQAAVPARGNARYQEYGDPIAKQRLNDTMAHAKRNMTGSRTGFNAFLGVGSGSALQGTLTNLFEDAAAGSIYRPDRIDPERYWALEDRIWKEANVFVGDLEATKLRPVSPPPRSDDQSKP